ncbi:hypothetical protein EXIGLDRAFT_765165 [Exidia glandulosa HHB12029]|uniref:Uncharacterized protein n=1 Tax=Exidia glandulosa HHB12029 TaxID=1314781 RepID=A0A165KP39_EXIGL|nr:hypothetical protein EXIGLDRAFT_765165 [Exidia glandulosa HHB12029]
MARAAAAPVRTPVADLDADAQREELQEIRDREDLWRQLKVLFRIEDKKYPATLAMLERWILLDDPMLPKRDEKRSNRLWDALCDAVEAFNEAVDDSDRVSAAAHRQFLVSAASCALSWATLANVVHEFEDDEWDWVALRDAGVAADHHFASCPDFSTSRARLVARKAALLEALGERDKEREETPPAPTIEEPIDSPAASPPPEKRPASRVAAGEPKSKRARVEDGNGTSGEDELSQREDASPNEGASRSRGKKRRKSTPFGAPFGVADGEWATKKCERCAHKGVECRARLHRQSGRPGRCYLCFKLDKDCEGAVWGAPAEDPGAVALRKLEASLDELKASTDAKLDEQADLIRNQTEEIRELRDLLLSFVPSIDLHARARAGRARSISDPALFRS